jgi:hypothetical protein
MKINVSSEQWSDLILIYLLDTIRKPKAMESTSQDFKEFMEKARQVLRPLLIRHYLNADVEQRVKYRLIRSAFTKDKRATVDINAVKEEL